MDRNDGAKITFARQILEFDDMLSCQILNIPTGFKVINPFNGDQKYQVKQVAKIFYQKYYNDIHTRRLILGSSPARHGSAIIGIPFEDSNHLQNETGIHLNKFYINRSSSDFIGDVIKEYGGHKKFYNDFYMNFVCPLGIARLCSNGKEVNYNYYENKQLQQALYPFIIKALKCQMGFYIDTSICYCIGSDQNYNFLVKINRAYKFFDSIMPLEHPRFITQYNPNKRSLFLHKYINALCNCR